MKESETRLYKIFHGMKQRCFNRKRNRYHCYGGKGITIYKEWLEDYLSFKKWALENGYKEGLTIDRINVNGNYEPNNCRWATSKQQNNNRNNNHLITYNNETHTMKEWSEILNINYRTLSTRLNRDKLSVKEAFEKVS